jgi:hypothetical protein
MTTRHHGTTTDGGKNGREKKEWARVDKRRKLTKWNPRRRCKSAELLETANGDAKPSKGEKVRNLGKCNDLQSVK